MAMVAPILAMVAGVLIALYLGKSVGQGNTFMVMAFFGATFGAAFILAARRHIWLLIPLCWPLTGSIGFLPLPFNVQELGVLTAFSVFLAQIAMKQFRGMGTKIDYLDVLLWINAGLIVVMFLKNPIGLAFLGTEQVGGRPYLKVLVGLLAFIVLKRIVIGPKLGYYFPLITLGPSFLVGIINMLTQIFPFLTPLIAPIYSGVNVESYLDEQVLNKEAGGLNIQGRYQGLTFIGPPLVTALIAYNNPFRVMSPMKPGHFAVLTFAVLCIGMAGFRNVFFATAITMIIAAYFWEKGIGVIKMSMVGLAAVVLIIATQAVVDLPRSIQRSLSFLPGPWNTEVAQGAKESTDWRVEMWVLALTSDKYIKDKVMGDGFGFSKEDLEIMRGSSFGGAGFIGEDNMKEAFMIQGSFHSGPVSSIRFAGAVGLVAIAALLIGISLYSVKVLREAWNTPFRPLAITLAVAAVYAPFAFIFIFGEYRNDLPNAFFACGMLKMTRNSIKQFLEEKRMDTNIPAPIPDPALRSAS